MVSDLQLLQMRDHEPGGGMGGEGPAPAPWSAGASIERFHQENLVQAVCQPAPCARRPSFQDFYEFGRERGAEVLFGPDPQWPRFLLSCSLSLCGGW